MLSFDQWPVWASLAVFAASAAGVWAAASRLARYADVVAERTGIGSAFAGMLFLGGISSLPEAAAVATSAAAGSPALALNNLLGSAAANVVLLAAADAVLGRDALTAVVAKPATLLQGALCILAFAGLAMAATIGDTAVLGVGLWSAGLLLFCLAALFLSSRYERRHVWSVVDGPAAAPSPDRPAAAAAPRLGAAILGMAAAAGVILAAGFLLSRTAEAIAAASGLGSGFIGFVLLAFATSLPELSSIVAALRLGRYEMAIGDAFGTNLFVVGLVFLADLVDGGGAVLAEAGAFEATGALLTVVLAAVFLVGLLERQDRTVLRMGYDSLVAIAVYAGGLLLLYRLVSPG